MNVGYKLSLTNQAIEDAGLAAKDVLINTRNAIEFIQNIYPTMANFAGFLDTHAWAYKLFREKSGFDAVEHDVVF